MSIKVSYKIWENFEGKDVFLFIMENINGSYVLLTNYGASIVSIVVPDGNKRLVPVALGFREFEGYKRDTCYIGSTIGRFANRIGGAGFTLDGERYTLDPNDGSNTNHGGKDGFHKKVFDFQVTKNTVTFYLNSPDGEGGFPGTVEFKVTYSWNDAHELTIVYAATSDKKTVVNFTNHAYFNLGGTGNILNHDLTVFAENMIETDSSYIPTGRIIKVEGEKGQSRSIQNRIAANAGKGLNQYYLFDPHRDTTQAVCQLQDEGTGIQLNVFTSFPGVQVYSGDYLRSNVTGHHGKSYSSQDGMCLECQFPPDSPNHAHFPSTVLENGQEFSHYIQYKFEI